MATNDMKILAIDDHPDNLTSLKAVVLDRLPGTKLVTALSGAQGLGLARTEDPDVILLDIVMPGMDGYEVCRRLKEDGQTQTIPVLFLTALRTDRDSRIKALETGADGFLTKPFDEVELIVQIKAMAKVKAANRLQRMEKDQLARLVAERTQELERELAERKRVEEARRESEAKFRSLFESSRDAILTLEPPFWRFTTGNPAAVRMFGAKNEEDILSREPWELSPEEQPGGRASVDQAKDMIETAMREGSHFFEWTHRQIGGGEFLADILLTRMELGGQVALQVNIRDITERKRVEEAVKQEQVLSKAIIDSIPGTFYVLDEKGRYVRWNAYQRDEIVGLPEDLVSGMNSADTIHPDDRAYIQSKIANVLTNGIDEAVEGRVLLRGGPAFRWLLMTGRKITIGDRPFLVGIGIDVTERKRADEQIKMLSIAVEQSPASIVITDPQGRIEYVNPKFTRVTGYTLDEARGQNPRILKGDKTSAEEYRNLWQTIIRGHEWRGEFHNRKKSGELFWEFASISPIVDREGQITHFLAVKEDITERKALEEQVRQAQKLESIGQLAGGVAHDYNNILAATMMRLELLEDTPDLDQQTKGLLSELMEDAKRGANLTRQLLLFSRRSVMEVKVLDLNELVANLLKLLGRLIGEHITVRFERREVLSAVAADSGMLEQVLTNLAVNARDAMPKGGRITINVEEVQVDAERGSGNPEGLKGKFVCLSVADNGCGMDDVTLKRIFEPFFTTKEVGRGTGLGLATVHGIVAQHKGWVEVESQLGQGTTFKVFLPAVRREMPGLVETVKSSIRGGNETILLVEDEASVRVLLTQSLLRLGYRVLEASNGLMALKLWQEQAGNIDLLFSDMVMPEGLTGLDLAEKMRAEKAGLKVVISSGYNEDMVGQIRSTAGGIVYLQKPYPVDVLSKTIRNCLDHQP